MTAIKNNVQNHVSSVGNALTFFTRRTIGKTHELGRFLPYKYSPEGLQVMHINCVGIALRIFSRSIVGNAHNCQNCWHCVLLVLTPQSLGSLLNEKVTQVNTWKSVGKILAV